MCWMRRLPLLPLLFAAGCSDIAQDDGVPVATVLEYMAQDIQAFQYWSEAHKRAHITMINQDRNPEAQYACSKYFPIYIDHVNVNLKTVYKKDVTAGVGAQLTVFTLGGAHTWTKETSGGSKLTMLAPASEIVFSTDQNRIDGHPTINEALDPVHWQEFPITSMTIANINALEARGRHTPCLDFEQPVGGKLEHGPPLQVEADMTITRKTSYNGGVSTPPNPYQIKINLTFSDSRQHSDEHDLVIVYNRTAEPL